MNPSQSRNLLEVASHFASRTHCTRIATCDEPCTLVYVTQACRDQAALLSATIGRCLRPSRCVTTSRRSVARLNNAIGVSVCVGAVRARVSNGGRSLAGILPSDTSFGVRPQSVECGRSSLYQVRYSDNSASNRFKTKGIATRRVHSVLRVRMKRSTTAIEPCCPTAPKRGLMLQDAHHAL